MTDDFHDGTLVFEFFEFVLFNDFALDFFDSYHSVLPFSFINYTIASFRYFLIVRDIFKWDFVILNKGSSFI